MSFESDTKTKNKRRAKVGRPLKLDYNAFHKLVEDYLEETKRLNTLPTLTELSLRLGIDDLTAYGKRARFAQDIKRVKQIAEVWITSKLSSTDKPLINHIFLAKAIAGLRDNADLGTANVQIGKGVVILPKRG